MKIQDELANWAQENDLERYEDYFEAVKELLDELDLDELDDWLFDHVSEDELAKLYDLAHRFVDLYTDTAGLTHFKGDEMARFEAMQHEFAKWMD